MRWYALIAKLKLKKHSAIVKYLKSEHSVTHGFVNFIAAQYLPNDEPEDLVENQYRGPKAALRPIYNDIVSFATALGDDVTIAPKKTASVCGATSNLR